MINADEKLKPIFGGKNRASMFDPVKHLEEPQLSNDASKCIRFPRTAPQKTAPGDDSGHRNPPVQVPNFAETFTHETP